MGVNWARSPYVDYGEDNPKKSVEELIANLAQEVAQLKREVNELKASKANREDIEKFAETASNAELLAKKVAKKDDDIAELGRVFLRILKREADE